MEASERLKKHYRVDGGHWIWTGGHFDRTRPAFYYESRPQDARRAAWKIHVGSLPSNMYLQQTCDADGCINPAHMRKVTPKQAARKNVRLEELLWKKVNKQSGVWHDGTECWRYERNSDDDEIYPTLSLNGVLYYPHKVVYELLVGDIPKDYSVGRACRNNWCVQPKHLFCCTRSELFDQHKRDVCKNGHPYDDNTYVSPIGWRHCEQCRQDALERHTARRKRGESGVSNGSKTHCINGHAYDDENTYLRKRNGKVYGRGCRTCMRTQQREYYRARVRNE
jgi:hypothetical protein